MVYLCVDMEMIITNPARLLAPSHLKKCTHQDCLQWKPYSQFRKQTGYADGYKSWCNECSRHYSKEYYHRIKALNPQYRQGELKAKYPSSKWRPPVPAQADSCPWIPFEPLKQCRKWNCLKFKPLSQFRKDERYAGKHRTCCRECEIKSAREFRHFQRSTPTEDLFMAVNAPIGDYKPRKKYCIIEPKKLSFRFVMARNIAYTRRELKRLRGRDRIPTTNVFTIKEFVGLYLIRKNAFLSPNTFLGHRIHKTYVPRVAEEFIHKDEYCYGEPPSSFRDFIKDAGEVKYLMTLDEDGNYLHEQVMTEETFEIQFTPKKRPELLRVA